VLPGGAGVEAGEREVALGVAGDVGDAAGVDGDVGLFGVEERDAVGSVAGGVGGEEVDVGAGDGLLAAADSAVECLAGGDGGWSEL
jgi:hypothetical protein